MELFVSWNCRLDRVAKRNSNKKMKILFLWILGGTFLTVLSTLLLPSHLSPSHSTPLSILHSLFLLDSLSEEKKIRKTFQSPYASSHIDILGVSRATDSSSQWILLPLLLREKFSELHDTHFTLHLHVADSYTSPYCGLSQALISIECHSGAYHLLDRPYTPVLVALPNFNFHDFSLLSSLAYILDKGYLTFISLRRDPSFHSSLFPFLTDITEVDEGEKCPVQRNELEKEVKSLPLEQKIMQEMLRYYSAKILMPFHINEFFSGVLGGKGDREEERRGNDQKMEFGGENSIIGIIEGREKQRGETYHELILITIKHYLNIWKKEIEVMTQDNEFVQFIENQMLLIQSARSNIPLTSIEVIKNEIAARYFNSF